MREAQRLVRAARAATGRERYEILVEASKIVVALREPRVDRAAFQRAEWALEVAIGTIGDCAGCLAMRASLADEPLYARVKRLVNADDPIKLIRAGAPADEYHAEINEIACRLPEESRTLAKTHAMVHGVFVKWFGKTLAGPRGAYVNLAKKLHAVRPRRPDPRAAEIARLKITPEEARAIFEYAKARLQPRAKKVVLDPATRAKMKVLLGGARR